MEATSNSDQNGAIILYNPEACTGCHMCELVCSFTHFDKTSILLSRIIIYKDKATATFVPTVCISCPGMPCARVCPVDAIIKDEKTGMPRIIEDKCLGKECGKCVTACPYNAIRFNPNSYPYPLICDLCGGDPQCVKVCWSDALKIVELTKSANHSRFIMAASSIKKINTMLKHYEVI